MTDLTDDPQSAMVLTESEWADLAVIVKMYEQETRWVFWAKGPNTDIVRRRSLAQRIIEAET